MDDDEFEVWMTYEKDKYLSRFLKDPESAISFATSVGFEYGANTTRLKIQSEMAEKYDYARETQAKLFRVAEFCSGWVDLDVLWKHIVGDTESKLIDLQHEYAKARDTDISGTPNEVHRLKAEISKLRLKIDQQSKETSA